MKIGKHYISIMYFAATSFIGIMISMFINAPWSYVLMGLSVLIIMLPFFIEIHE